MVIFTQKGCEQLTNKSGVLPIVGITILTYYKSSISSFNLKSCKVLQLYRKPNILCYHFIQPGSDSTYSFN